MLWATRRADGSWDERSNVGPVSTANVVVALHYAGLLPRADLEGAARWLRGQQQPDGGFLPYPYAPGSDLGTTAQAWAALSLSREAADRGAARRAAAFVHSRGGPQATLETLSRGDLSAVYLALAGLLSPALLPSPPIAWALFDGLVGAMSERFHFGIVMGALQLPLIAEHLSRERAGGQNVPDSKNHGWLTRRQHARAIELFAIFQNSDGSWNSNTIQTAIMIPALLAAGLGRDDPRVRRAASWLSSRRVEEDVGTWFDVFASDVWSTAFNVRALLDTGVLPNDPRIVESLGWLLSRQLEIPQPRVNNRQEGAVRTGGWPFQTGNETMADTDDTGVVLSAFGAAMREGPNGERLPAELDSRIRKSVERARRWLSSMQNEDGGWGAFVWGVPSRRPKGPLFVRPIDVPTNDIPKLIRLWRHPPPELGDPSAEDLTGRVLHGLACFGADTTYPEVDRAVRFLRDQQLESGGWWSRWLCNYLASTSFVLSALAEAREDMDEVYVKQAIDWVLSRQNGDGGFGESPESYRDPAKAGVGPSTVPLTSLVVMGLCDAGRAERPEVGRAIDYVLRNQRPDGTWPNGEFLLTNIPPDSFYTYSGNARHLPLLALGSYLRRRPAPRPAAQHGRWSSAVLAPFRHRTDPVADEVVARIYQGGDLASINALLRSILENDDPIPPGLPPEARAFFDATDEMPPWADARLIRRAQELFETFGVYVTYGLFASSLPQAYASAHGAEVLVQTGAMLDRVRQRIFETAQFLFDVLDTGSLDPKGRGIRSAQRVRLMHAAIRHLIEHRAGAPWDAELFGKPINQEDLAGTLMTFSAITFDAMRRFGLELDKDDADAWIHHWNVVGHFMGIDHALLPLDYYDAEQLTEAVRQRHWAPSPQGRRLAAALIAMMQEFFTKDEPLLDGLMPSLVRYLSGDLCADILGLPPADWTKHLVRAFTDVTDVVDLSYGDETIQKGLGRVAVGAMKWITEVERGHKKASFRIPESLRKTVLPGT